MEWISVKDRFPEEDVQYLCNKKYMWSRGDNHGVFYTVEILTWNSHYGNWDDEDADDYNCDADTVSHWMPLPKQPIINNNE